MRTIITGIDISTKIYNDLNMLQHKKDAILEAFNLKLCKSTMFLMNARIANEALFKYL